METASWKVHTTSLKLRNTIVIRKGRIVWKHGSSYCSHFRLNLKYVGWLYKAYIKTAKNGGFCEQLLSENGFEAVWVTLRCYDMVPTLLRQFRRIARDQGEYCKCSSCVIIWWIAKIHLSINSNEKGLVT